MAKFTSLYKLTFSDIVKVYGLIYLEPLMSLMRKVMGSLKRPLISPPQEFVDFFHMSEGESDSPFSLALSELDHLQERCLDEDDFLNYSLDEIIYISLNATFFEELFIVIQENQGLGKQLIDKFTEKAQEREALILAQTQAHSSYIKSNGVCHGCDFCEYHQDVHELLSTWHNKKVDFFVDMYVGMFTIHFTFEQILYDLLTVNPSYYNSFSREKLTAFRQYLFNYAKKHL